MTDQLLPVASGRRTLREVATLLGRQRAGTVLAMGVLLASTVATLAVPPLLGAITDTVLERRGTGRVDLLTAALVVAFVLHALLSGWAYVLVADVGERALADVRERVVDVAVHLPLADVERAGTGDLLARVGDDVATVSAATRDAVPTLLWSVLTIALTIVGLGVLDWRLALAGLAAAPVQLAATRWYLRRAGPRYAAERAAGSRRAQQLAESIGAAVTVRGLGASAHHRSLVARASGESLDRSLRARRTGSVFFAFLNGAELVGLATTLVVGFALVRADVVTVGAATAAALYFQALFNPMGTLLGQLDTAQDAGAALARLVGVTGLARADRAGARAGGLGAGSEASGRVELDDVSFAYVAGRPVLHEVDIDAGPGERVALVGTSGAGKSTIAKLVAGIHTPVAGRVAVDGDVHLVTQEVHTFAGTVADDLRLARPDASDDELLVALETVGATDWVLGLPDALATVVGEGGHGLTATQAQHLALARVVLVGAPIVVLDEATADAGSAGARTLERAADAATRGRTTIVVAHRLTQAAAADRVVVLERGRVAEVGSHAELVDGEGRYAALWASWSDGRRTAPT